MCFSCVLLKFNSKIIPQKELISDSKSIVIHRRKKNHDPDFLMDINKKLLASSIS